MEGAIEQKQITKKGTEKKKIECREGKKDPTESSSSSISGRWDPMGRDRPGRVLEREAEMLESRTVYMHSEAWPSNLFFFVRPSSQLSTPSIFDRASQQKQQSFRSVVFLVLPTTARQHTAEALCSGSLPGTIAVLILFFSLLLSTLYLMILSLASSFRRSVVLSAHGVLRCAV